VSLFNAPGPPKPDTVYAGSLLMRFLHEGAWLAVTSSCIRQARYDMEQEQLFVKFYDKKTGADVAGTARYSPISLAEALAFAQAGSHNGWIWDVCRVRGTRHAHKKNFFMV
jgi:hypothetical protein